MRGRPVWIELAMAECVAVAGAGIVIRLLHRHAYGIPVVPGLAARDLTLYEFACLSGGAERVVQTAMTGMYLDGRLQVTGNDIAPLAGADPRDPIEAAVVTACRGARPVRARTAQSRAVGDPAVRRIEAELVRAGLFLRPNAAVDVAKAVLLLLLLLAWPVNMFLLNRSGAYSGDAVLVGVLPVLLSVAGGLLLRAVPSPVEGATGDGRRAAGAYWAAVALPRAGRTKGIPSEAVLAQVAYVGRTGGGPWPSLMPDDLWRALSGADSAFQPDDPPGLGGGI